jgi:hypothetical protein
MKAAVLIGVAALVIWIGAALGSAVDSLSQDIQASRTAAMGR